MNLPEETFDLSFRAVVYREEDLWTAHALELDLVGCAETPDEALKELAEMIECQVTFAMQMGDANLIYRDAPPEVFAIWDEAESRKRETIFNAGSARGGVALSSRPTVSEEEEGPLAKFLGLSGQKLNDLRRTPLELIPCG